VIPTEKKYRHRRTSNGATAPAELMRVGVGGKRASTFLGKRGDRPRLGPFGGEKTLRSKRAQKETFGRGERHSEEPGPNKEGAKFCLGGGPSKGISFTRKPAPMPEREALYLNGRK